MKVSVGARPLLFFYGIEDGLKMLADAGFEAVDFPLNRDELTPWEEGFFKDPSGAEFAEYFSSLGKLIRDLGLEVYQTHAPYLRTNCSDPAEYDAILRKAIRAIHASGYMGAPNIVVHPVMHPDFSNGQNRERMLRTNLEYFGKMVPALKAAGVTACIENVFWSEGEQVKVPNACSDGEQLACLIDALNDLHGPCFAACLDTGHAVVSGNDPCRMIRELGQRTRVLHLQDNRGIVDDHMFPGMGVINWKEFLSAMKEAGYSGTLNFEVRFSDYEKDIYNRDVRQTAYRLVYHIGRSMADIADGIRNIDYENGIYNRDVRQAASELLYHIGRSRTDIEKGISGDR